MPEELPFLKIAFGKRFSFLFAWSHHGNTNGINRLTGLYRGRLHDQVTSIRHLFFGFICHRNRASTHLVQRPGNTVRYRVAEIFNFVAVYRYLGHRIGRPFY